MISKFKNILPLLLISFALFISFETKHVKPIGDLILGIVGLNSWSNGESGTHFTVFYSIGIIIVIVWLIRRSSKYEYNTKLVLIVLISTLTLFALITNYTAEFFKGNKGGILAIGYNDDDSMMGYTTTSSGLQDFNAIISLTNYSDRAIDFSLDISRTYSDTGTCFDIYNLNGDDVMLHLEPKETREFSISSKEYIIKVKDNYMVGVVQINQRMEVVLWGLDGEVVKFSKDDFWGTTKVN